MIFTKGRKCPKTRIVNLTLLKLKYKNEYFEGDNFIKLEQIIFCTKTPNIYQEVESKTISINLLLYLGVEPYTKVDDDDDIVNKKKSLRSSFDIITHFGCPGYQNWNGRKRKP